MFKHRHKGPNF